MTIQVLDDVIVPNCVIMAGVAGRQTRQNDRTSNQGGYASANVVRDATMREYAIGIKPMPLNYWSEIEGLYEITDAGAFGMLLEDPKDSVVTVADSGLQGYMSGVEFGAPGFGNGTPLYGLRQFKKAASSTRTRARTVTRPNGTPLLFRGGAPVTLGTAAGNAALSAGPVYATFVPDATRTVTAVAVGASTQVTLSSSIGVLVGGRLWLQGIAGADAALLNGRSHTVTALTGAVYTLATNTTGKTITAAGQGHKYPQPDEALTWAGSFYVPVQFADDNMDWDLVRPGDLDDRLVSGPTINLIEIREA